MWELGHLPIFLDDPSSTVVLRTIESEDFGLNCTILDS